MSQVLKFQESAITIIITDSTGAFVSGLAPEDATLHLRKTGGLPEEKILTADNFSEIDAIAMPGLYEITFTSSDLDTLGELVAVLKQDGAIDFENQTLRLEVVNATTDTLDERLVSLDTTTSHVRQGTSYTLPLVLNERGILPREVTARVLKGDGTVFTLEVTEDNWEEVEGLFAVYRLTLPPEATDALGELAVFATFKGETFLGTVEVVSTSNTYEGLSYGSKTGPAPVRVVNAHVKDGGEDGLMWLTGKDEELGGGAFLLESKNGGDSFSLVDPFLSDLGYNNIPFGVDGIHNPGSGNYEVFIGIQNNSNVPTLQMWNGATLTEIVGTGYHRFFDVHAYQPDSVWAAGFFEGDSGTLYLYDGTSLNQIFETTETADAGFRGVHQLTDTRVMAAGLDGVYEGVLDGTWTFTDVTSRFTAPTTTRALSIDFSDNGVYGAVLFGTETTFGTPSNLSLFATNDGGLTWFEVGLPTELDGVNFLANNYSGYVQVAGTGGIWLFLSGELASVQYDKVWISEDGGNRWSSEEFSDRDITRGHVQTTFDGRFTLIGSNVTASDDPTENTYHRIEADVFEAPLGKSQVQVTWDADNTTSHVKIGSPYTLPVRLSKAGLTFEDVEASVLKGNGTLFEIELDTNNWEEVEGLHAVYRLTLPPEATDEEGELVVYITAQGEFFFDKVVVESTSLLYSELVDVGNTVFQWYSSGSVDVEFHDSHVRDPEGYMWLSGYFWGESYGTLFESEDGGQTFTVVDEVDALTAEDTKGFAVDGTDTEIFLALDIGAFSDPKNLALHQWDGTILNSFVTTDDTHTLRDLHVYSSNAVWGAAFPKAGSDPASGPGKIYFFDGTSLDLIYTTPTATEHGFRGIYQVNETRTYAVGQGGVFEGLFDAGSWDFTDVTSAKFSGASTTEAMSVDFSEERGLGAILFGSDMNSVTPSLFITEDEGDTWSELALPTELNEAYTFNVSSGSVQVVGTSSIWVFASAVDSLGNHYDKMWISEDKGETWLPEEFSFLDITRGHVVADGANRFSLVASSYDAGVSGGATFEPTENSFHFVTSEFEEEAGADLSEAQVQVVENTATDVKNQVLLSDDKTTSHIKVDESYTFPVKMLPNSDGVIDDPILSPLVKIVAVKGSGSVAEYLPDTWNRVDEDRDLYSLTVSSDVVSELGELLLLLESQIDWVLDDFEGSGADLTQLSAGGIREDDQILVGDIDGNVYTSNDGGQTFDAGILVDNGPVFRIEKAPNENAYLLVSTQSGSMGSSLRGSAWINDGTWTQIDASFWDLVGDENNISDLSVFDNENIWLITYSGSKLRYFNGTSVDSYSITLEPAPSGTAGSSTSPRVIHQSSPTKVWAGGRENFVYEGTLVDGTWEFEPNADASFDSDPSNDDYILDIHFFDEDHGVIVGESSTFKLKYTSDGGQTWVERTDSPILSSYSRINMASPTEIWLTTSGSISLVSRDAGVTWDSIMVLGSGRPTYDLEVFSDAEGVAAGRGLAFLLEGQFASKEIQVQVVGDTASDVMSDLETIKGATFDTNTHSLVELKEAILANEIDLSDVTDPLDSLLTRVLFADDKTTSHISQGEAHVFPVRVTNGWEKVSGVTSDQVSVSIVKPSGALETVPISGTEWEEIPGTTGIYRLTILGSYTDIEGELLINIEGAVLLSGDTNDLTAQVTDTVDFDTTDNMIRADFNLGVKTRFGLLGRNAGGDLVTHETSDGGLTFTSDVVGITSFLYSSDPEDRLLPSMFFNYSGHGWFLIAAVSGTTQGNIVLARLHPSNGWENFYSDYDADLTDVWVAKVHSHGTSGLVAYNGTDGTGDEKGFIYVQDGDQMATGNFDVAVTSLYAISSSKIYAGGDNGRLWFSTGWSAFEFVDVSAQSPTNKAILDLDFNSGFGVMGAGDLGVGAPKIDEVFITLDEGDTWESVSTLPSGVTFDQVFVSDVATQKVVGFSREYGIFQTDDTMDQWLSVEITGSFVGAAFAPDPDTEDQMLLAGGVSSGSANLVTLEVVTVEIDGREIQVQVVGDTSVDLTPVTNSLDDIKGTGFDSNTDSLTAIKAAITAGDVDLSPVIDILEDIQGATFVAGEHDLVAIKAAVDAVSGEIDFTTIENALDEIKGTGFVEASDSLEQLRLRLITAQESLDNAAEVLARVVGLSQENVRITGQQYDSNSNLIESTLTIHENSADVATGSNPIATYTMTASYNSENRLVDYQLVRGA